LVFLFNLLPVISQPALQIPQTLNAVWPCVPVVFLRPKSQDALASAISSSGAAPTNRAAAQTTPLENMSATVLVRVFRADALQT
jgi:hypothetical protein